MKELSRQLIDAGFTSPFFVLAYQTQVWQTSAALAPWSDICSAPSVDMCSPASPLTASAASMIGITISPANTTEAVTISRIAIVLLLFSVAVLIHHYLSGLPPSTLH